MKGLIGGMGELGRRPWVRKAPEVEAMRRTTVARGEAVGVGGLSSGADEAAGVDGLASRANEVAGGNGFASTVRPSIARVEEDVDADSEGNSLNEARAEQSVQRVQGGRLEPWLERKVAKALVEHGLVHATCAEHKGLKVR